MDLLTDLNEPQREAVTHIDGPLLVLAGAGSGKTRVITRRIAHLIRQGVAPWNILAITFTNKAAGEMRERVDALRAPAGATIATFHALCARLLREFAPDANMTSNYSIYDRDDQLRLVKEAMGAAEIEKGRIRPAAAHAVISNAKNELVSPVQFSDQAEGFQDRLIGRVYKQYQRLLHENNAVDFDDLLVKVALLLRDRPELRSFLSQRYKYILIDEYQDTNHVQYLIAHGLAMEHNNLCVTGDPDQSIYAWRGANIRNILEFESDYPDATVIRLEENYRSTTAILTTASKLIAHNTERKDKSLWTRREGGADVTILKSDNEHTEADLIARRLRQRVDDGAGLDGVAVFYRVNSLSRVLEEALLKRGVPYRIARGVEFYNRKEIRDVLAYLRLLVNPADDLACSRIINTPTRGIGATTIRRLSEHAAGQGVSMLQAARTPEDAGVTQAPARKIAKFLTLMDELRTGLDKPLGELVEHVFKASRLDASFGDDEEAEQARANVGELISAAAEFDQMQTDAALEDFLHHVGLVSDVDRMDGSAGGAVTLMTLHAAKGLEFPVVYMVGCEEGLLPFRREQTWGSDDADVEEERRLAFVGMTRAQDELTLSCASIRRIYGKRTPQTASVFLDEIGEEHVTIDDQTTRTSPGRPVAGGGFYEDQAMRSKIESRDDWGAAPSDPDPFDVADPDPYETPVPAEYESLAPGKMVHHPKFGRGKVISLTQPWPSTRATIQFGQWGLKKIVLSKVNLDVL
ncbi:MAG: ATP-dependent helicase [Planctomycetota bacterium]